MKSQTLKVCEHVEAASHDSSIIGSIYCIDGVTGELRLFKPDQRIGRTRWGHYVWADKRVIKVGSGTKFMLPTQSV